MPLPNNHPLLELARNVLRNPSLWENTAATVREKSFQRGLAASGQFLAIAVALFDTAPLGPKPEGFLAAALAFEMADAFQDAEKSGISGLRALEEPFNSDDCA